MEVRYKCLNCGTSLVKEEIGSPLLMSRAEAVRAAGMSDNKFRALVQNEIDFRPIGDTLYCEVADFLRWFRSLPKSKKFKTPERIAREAVHNQR